ncbi:MAG: gluconeogenesis factor YvcK family protein [Patescibacteria group bacterium]|nr:gluconeogenesis factor YvcK family protein [Patescibacteria group bacterium]
MKNKKIVTIGGGTGSFTLLSGLKNYQYDITAIVTMADDGGSTGKLRDELGVLPPGDVRQCLVALSDSTEELRELMNYRFEEGGLEGHNFGNLFLSALEKINGSFSSGIIEAIKILNVQGSVIPVSEDDMRLTIKLNDGHIITGEKELDENQQIRETGIYEVRLARSVRANKRAVKAIEDASFVIIGPGDHYGSIVPNLLVSGIKNAIKKTKASVIFVAPLTNKMGQTDGFTVEDYVQNIEKLIGKKRINFVVYNSKKPHKDMVKRYEKKEGKNLLVTCKNIEDKKYKIVEGDLLRKEQITKTNGDKLAHTRAFIRHDSNKLARAIALITEYSEYRSFNIS